MKVKNFKVVTGTLLSLGMFVVTGTPAIAQSDCVALRRRPEQTPPPVVQEPVQEERVVQEMQTVPPMPIVEEETASQEVVEEQTPVRAMW